jgi:hypothetical protein
VAPRWRVHSSGAVQHQHLQQSIIIIIIIIITTTTIIIIIITRQCNTCGKASSSSPSSVHGNKAMPCLPE